MSAQSDSAPTVLLVDDEEYVLESLRRLLELDRFRCIAASSADRAMAELTTRDVDVMVTDLSMPGEDGLALLRKARELRPQLPVIVLTGVGTVQSAVAAMKQGAVDFLQKPVDPEALVLLLRRAVEHGKLVDEVRSLRALAGDRVRPQAMIGDSTSMNALRRAIAAVAATEARVLIRGESGTGKELIAHAIHAQSRRSRKPFVRVNCAAIPESLFESEMFGHKKGAFTGAVTDRDGRFAEAHGGTLVLDEVGTLASVAQAKLLRVLESGEFAPVGEPRLHRCDVRVISITNEDLAERVRSGTFREDLYFRLNVVPIVAPALRDRLEDLPKLVSHCLERLSNRDGIPQKRISRGALEVLASYDWPGNVRELFHAVERAALLVPGEEIYAEEILPVVESGMLRTPRPQLSGADPKLDDEADLRLRERTQALEKQLIQEALRRCGGRKREACALLGIAASNFAYYAKKHQIADGAAT